MIKRDELTDPSSCMSRALPDERTFVLLARDEAAPDTIREWVARRLGLGKNVITDPQIVDALASADLMDRERPAVKNAVARAVAPATAGIASGMSLSVALAQLYKLVDAEVQRPGDVDSRYFALKRVRGTIQLMNGGTVPVIEDEVRRA